MSNNTIGASHHAPTEKSGKVIALVNDELVQRNRTSLWLRDAGYTVWVYESAADALADMSDSRLPDVIVTDLFMPGIDGWRFCRLLKSAEFPAFNHVPVIVASVTYSGDDANRITRALGADRFLALPVDRKTFIAEVAEVLRSGHSSEQPRVLIVEDSSSLLELLNHAFTTRGYSTCVAATGGKARQLLQTSTFDYVILDNHLPDTTGEEILEATAASRSETAFIMITADSDPQLAVQWMQKGASGYVKKPFDPAYLVELCVKAGRERSLLRIESLLEERTRELTAGHERYKTLLRELQHRVKNSMAIISSLIGLELTKSESTETRDALEHLRRRVRSISDLYALLNDSEFSDTVALDHYLQTIGVSMSEIVGNTARAVPVQVQADPLTIPAKQAATIGLVATELVTNAFKYSTAVSDGTTIDLLLTVSTTDRRATLEVWNKGATLPPDFKLSDATGLGLQLVSMLADQLGASISCESGDDTVFRLEFPW
jgi:two-component sensor histidine kinase